MENHNPKDTTEALKQYNYHVLRVKTAAGTELPELMRNHHISWLSPVIQACKTAEANAAATPDNNPAGRPDDWQQVSDAARAAAENCKNSGAPAEIRREITRQLWVIIRHATAAIRAAERAGTRQ